MRMTTVHMQPSSVFPGPLTCDSTRTSVVEGRPVSQTLLRCVGSGAMSTLVE
eukprot:CAMPEP_0197936354 /NCGR_PEP_ID=MMETSP1439-20131203/114801_1 /TAXON_ID=66791 /ORGANISM="Gonyaulax spinifera, Strain CCMP409" /LENGTH=51 /DNA_ID=CAMNT_0043559321 /DNA_START=210 /DNA_END=362 /DNA_ORIENTATION=-